MAGIVTAFRQVAGSIAEVDREARKAGVTAKTWQQWQYVATATGASVDGVTDALKELNIRGDEFAKTGNGSAKAAFEALGYTAEEVAKKLKDPSRFLDEIIGKLQTLDAAARTRILDDMFGGTGAEEMAKVLGASVAEIQRMRTEAATFTDEQIEAAKKIDAEFNKIWRNFTVYAKKAAIESVGILGQIKSFLGGEWLPGYDQMEENRRYYGSDEFRLKRLQDERANLLRQIEDTESFPDSQAKDFNLQSFRRQLEEVDAEIANLTGTGEGLDQSLDQLGDTTQQTGGTFDSAATSAANFQTALEELKELVPDLKAELDTLAQSDAIETAYRKAADAAKNRQEYEAAGRWRDRARASAEIEALSGDVMARGRKVYSLLRDQGLSHAAAAGITGNAYQESRFDPTAMGDGGTSHGLFQHHGPRMNDLLAFGGRDNAAMQVAFAVQEMRRSGLFGRINSLSDPAEAARLFMTEFERPHPDHANLAARQGFARVAGGWGDPGMWEMPKIPAPDIDPWENLREVTSGVKDNLSDTTTQAEQLGSIAGTAISGLVSALADGKITAQEFSQILAQIAQQLLQMAFSGMQKGALAGGNNFLAGLLGGLLGFSGGGKVSGPGTGTSDSIPARLSDGEFVVKASEARKHGALLEAINSGRVASFAEGGHVGSTTGLARSIASTNNTTFAPSIAINVEGGSRGPEADKAMAEQIAKETRAAIRKEMAEFAQDQMRAGGLFSQRKTH
ncbi:MULTISPECIES: phage tail tip lysozyme [Chelativorans]|nr:MULTISPECIES: phage tail tip lysozyme [Chelativorans]